jgi:menaquinone-dependent protoporphyrinogen oxidase
MSASVLVAYATRHGSTQEVAETIAATLREYGLQVDIQPMQEVQTLDQYNAIVLGTPIYMCIFHRDATHFLEQHRSVLTTRPVAIFALGALHADEETLAREQLDKELAKFPWLTVQATAVFGGRFDPANLDYPLNLMAPLRNMPVSDMRDWKAIRAWASDLAAQFQPVPELGISQEIESQSGLA